MANLTGLETAFIYRLPFLLCGFVTAVCVWRLGNIIGGARAALASLLLFTLAPYMLIGGGVFVVPDGPLNMFLALSALALIRALSSNRMADWATTGLWLAFAMGCKYQAGLFPISVLAFLLLTRAQWRRMLGLGPWLAAAIGLLGLTPVILWNGMDRNWPHRDVYDHVYLRHQHVPALDHAGLVVRDPACGALAGYAHGSLGMAKSGWHRCPTLGAVDSSDRTRADRHADTGRRGDSRLGRHDRDF